MHTIVPVLLLFLTSFSPSSETSNVSHQDICTAFAYCKIAAQYIHDKPYDDFDSYYSEVEKEKNVKVLILIREEVTIVNYHLTHKKKINKEQLSTTYAYLKNARLLLYKGQKGKTQKHFNWANKQDTPTLKKAIQNQILAIKRKT